MICLITDRRISTQSTKYSGTTSIMISLSCTLAASSMDLWNQANVRLTVQKTVLSDFDKCKLNCASNEQQVEQMQDSVHGTWYIPRSSPRPSGKKTYMPKNVKLTWFATHAVKSRDSCKVDPLPLEAITVFGEKKYIYSTSHFPLDLVFSIVYGRAFQSNSRRLSNSKIRFSTISCNQ